MALTCRDLRGSLNGPLNLQDGVSLSKGMAVYGHESISIIIIHLIRMLYRYSTSPSLSYLLVGVVWQMKVDHILVSLPQAQLTCGLMGEPDKASNLKKAAKIKVSCCSEAGHCPTLSAI